MKPEQKQILIFILKILMLLGFAVLYAIGGSGDFFGGQLWIRRWLAPFLLSGAAYGLTRDWKYLVAFPIIAGSLTLPYGADAMGAKVLLRFLFGAAVGLAFNGPNLFNKKWALSGYGLLIGILTSIILGVLNPASNAIEEQGAIALILGFTYILGLQNKQQKGGVNA